MKSSNDSPPAAYRREEQQRREIRPSSRVTPAGRRWVEDELFGEGTVFRVEKKKSAKKNSKYQITFEYAGDANV